MGLIVRILIGMNSQIKKALEIDDYDLEVQKDEDNSNLREEAMEAVDEKGDSAEPAYFFTSYLL